MCVSNMLYVFYLFVFNVQCALKPESTVIVNNRNSLNRKQTEPMKLCALKKYTKNYD